MASIEEKTLRIARKRFRSCVDADSDNRDYAEQDLEFEHGYQWPDGPRRERVDRDAPVLVLNRVKAFVRQVVNDMRQMRPQIKVMALGGQDDVEQSLNMSGMIRAIESDCNADSAYAWAGEHAVKMGFGWIHVTPEWSNDETFEQVLRIRRVKNSFSAYIDPEHQEPDGSDAKYGFLIHRMEREEFEETYPGVDTSWNGDDEYRDWYGEDMVLVAKYWTVEDEAVRQYMLQDGRIGEGEVPDDAVMSRQILKRKIVHRLITGQDILEETTIPGKYIPLVPVYGEETDFKGERRLCGMVRDLKDGQVQYNFMRSASAERILAYSKAPWVGPTGAFNDPKWKTANTRNWPYLEYDVIDGHIPQRNAPPEISQGFVQEGMNAVEDMRAISGIYNAGLGDRSNEVAGVAINSRKLESDVSNFHFLDNLSKSIRHVGRILVDMIPKIYTEGRIVEIVGEEEDDKVMRQVGSPYIGKDGNEHVLSFDSRYNIAVDVGPTFTSQRQQAASSMEKIMASHPQLMSIAGDLMLEAMDWPHAKRIAKRLKATVPAEVMAGENLQIAQMLEQMNQQNAQTQQAAQEQVAQAHQMVQQIQHELQKREIAMKDKEYELMLKDKEIQRKAVEMQLDHSVDMTKIEAQYGRDVPGSAI